MSDTPITDSAKFWAREVDQNDHARPHEQVVYAEVCERLEREVARLRDEAAGLRQKIADADTLKRENTNLREQLRLAKNNAELFASFLEAEGHGSGLPGNIPKSDCHICRALVEYRADTRAKAQKGQSNE